MPKFQKPGSYPRPIETAVVDPLEPEVETSAEDTALAPSEMPNAGASQICGIGGCQTSYADPVIMQRHMERQHGIGGALDMNQPKPRNPNSPGDPVLKAMQSGR